MATITKRGTGWQAKIRRQGFPNYTATFDTKQEAEAWARDVESQLGYGGVPARVAADRLTLGDALDRYLAEVTPKKKGASVERYRVGRQRWPQGRETGAVPGNARSTGKRQSKSRRRDVCRERPLVEGYRGQAVRGGQVRA